MKIIWKRLLPFWIALISMAIYYVSLPPLSLRYTIFLVPAIWAALLVPNRLNWRPEERASLRAGNIVSIGLRR